MDAQERRDAYEKARSILAKNPTKVVEDVLKEVGLSRSYFYHRKHYLETKGAPKLRAPKVKRPKVIEIPAAPREDNKLIFVRGTPHDIAELIRGLS